MFPYGKGLITLVNTEMPGKVPAGPILFALCRATPVGVDDALGMKGVEDEVGNTFRING
jgi:hypothetical protein